MNNKNHDFQDEENKGYISYLARLGNINDLQIIEESEEDSIYKKNIQELMWIIRSQVWDNLDLQKDQKIPIILKKVWKKLKTQDMITGLQISNTWLKIQEIQERYKRFKLHKNSTRDGLTWLINRACINTILEKMIASRQRQKYETQEEVDKRNTLNKTFVLLLDIDNFKSLNDTYWHNIWDEVLREISKIFQELFQRPNDNIARWWGEEFLIIFEWKSLKDALNQANKLKETIENELANRINNKINDEIIKTKITISWWIVALNWEKKDDMIHNADVLLYQAKKQGRNQIHIYEAN